MTEFVRAATEFPAAFFGLLLIVVLAYWLLIAFGVLDVMFGLVATVVISLFVLFAWFAGLAGTVLLHRTDLSGSLPATGVLAAAVLASALITRLLMHPLRRMLTEEQVPTRRDFVGRMCVIRTGRVDLVFGQAEVRAADGSAAVIQVRQQRNRDDEAALKAGNTALIFDYDADGEFFWVMPYDAELDPHRPPR
ncbi:hypothetical protein GCM10027176_11000 [Actinoallomurus bryophytorum]|uniref:Membrane protein implicated in regulation of membrane protease activity n=1 Tax=Actinoallomurus bryophytorum TaxID=1490222 RepID=A0A543CQ52_9ACTN|nr:hypothetical protein [Actinoallomurus bryophytorum]TQL99209.1 hypothetical protein FB559_4866 [Actinoallomurus bryophytorum]